MNKEQQAQGLYRKVRQHQLADFRKRMPDDRQGVEFEINGTKYIAAIRRLTPTECGRLQTIPEDYTFVTSETQQYKGLGNCWTVDVIAHCFSFLPKELLYK